MTQQLLGDNHFRFLDELIDKGVNTYPSSSYPPLSPEENRMVKIFSDNLLVSFMSLAWSYYEFQQSGSTKGFERVRKRLLSPAVKMVVKR